MVLDPCDNIICGEGQVCVDGRCQGVDLCAGVVCSNTEEVCDPRDGMCYLGTTDSDGDGHTIGEGDCHDDDPLVYPGAEERCDGVDNDCDRDIDEGFPDDDDDGYDTCGFGNTAQADCDDSNPNRHPFRAESCDGLDNDCDEDIDEGIDQRNCTTTCGSGEERCVGGRWVCSAPETCECTPQGSVETEDCGNCGSWTRTCEVDLTWSTWSECSGEGDCAPGSFSDRSCGNCGTEERICSSDCTWGPWGECGAEGDCAPDSSEACTTSCGSTGTRVCDALCSWGTCSPPIESCNAVDDDCDDQCDEGCRHGVHRSNNGTDHLYCTSETEASCCGYTVEYLNFFYLSATEVPGTTEFWRCWRGAATDHFYTQSATCEGADATLEGSIGFIATSDICGTVPLYRLVNGTLQDHFYTTSVAERDSAVSTGWTYEAIAGYVWTSP